MAVPQGGPMDDAAIQKKRPKVMNAGTANTRSHSKSSAHKKNTSSLRNLLVKPTMPIDCPQQSLW